MRRRAAQRSEGQRERSREEFGSEYERTVEERGSRRFVSDPGQSDEETEQSLAILPPDVADGYRDALRIRAEIVARSARHSNQGEGSTEDLRQAIQKYRAVYQPLARR